MGGMECEVATARPVTGLVPTMRASAKGVVERHYRAMAFEQVRQAMSATASEPGSGVLGPLAIHATLRPIGSFATDAVLALLRGSAAPVPFEAVVAALGSRVAARFAVLELVGREAIRVLTPGYLSGATLVEACQLSAPAGGGGWH
ncbi:MAG: hypothetical protein WC804_06215 [Sphingomonas sp.]|uniref:hypothetical protein n=1 Tax=Sphingomonas sp. TaxID=28214 RepID=UPI00356139B1